MQNIKQIQWLSRFMQYICLAAIIGLPVFMAVFWYNFHVFFDDIAQQQGIVIQPDYVGPWNIVLGFVCSMLPMGIVMYGLWRLKALFALYQQAAFFTQANVRHLRAFSLALFANVLISPLAGALVSVVVTMNHPPGERALSISLGSGQLSTAFVAGVFLLVSAIMVEGRKLADDNAEIV